MKTQVKYPNLPRYIVMQYPIKRYKNTKTGEWVSAKELEIYAVTESKKEKKQEVKHKEHWLENYYNN